MTREDLEVGKYYTSGGEPIYKLVDVGTDWVLVLHYSTVHYVANAEFFKIDDFLKEFELDDDDWYNDDIFTDCLVYSGWQMLVNKERN